MEDKNPLFAVYSYKRKSIRETIWIAFIDTIKFNLVYTIRYITVRKVKRKWERIYIPYIYIWNYKAYIVETYDFYFCARYRRLRDITPVSFLEYGFLSGRNSSFLPATRLTDRNQPISNQILERAIEGNNWNKPSVLINLTFYPGSGLNSLDPRNRTRGEANFSPTPVKLKFISMDELCSHLLRFAPFLSSPPPEGWKQGSELRWNVDSSSCNYSRQLEAQLPGRTLGPWLAIPRRSVSTANSSN